jgi:hypothetical protein
MNADERRWVEVGGGHRPPLHKNGAMSSAQKRSDLAREPDQRRFWGIKMFCGEGGVEFKMQNVKLKNSECRRPPHPGLMASQARHHADAQQETIASGNVAPRWGRRSRTDAAARASLPGPGRRSGVGKRASEAGHLGSKASERRNLFRLFRLCPPLGDLFYLETEAAILGRCGSNALPATRVNPDKPG